ncbi:MAG: hypothetical protein DRQ24_00425 [Candidatus Latescibacterota bacterium]|nr:MAG: hypothetical protein DRQ24_00425 [Candidatus Latescibacterota bacterium]
MKLGLDPRRDQPKPNAELTSRSFLSSYLNPFNVETIIEFGLPERAFARLEVYNLLGQRAKTLAKGNMEAGRHLLIWSGKNEGEMRSPAVSTSVG